MNNLKIIDKLSGEEIPESNIISFCTNPVRDSDNWHYKNAMMIDEYTLPLNLLNVINANHPVFALHDDGRKEGAVWYPVTVINRIKQYRCYECNHLVKNIDGILNTVNTEDILCESCDEIITIHPGCTIVPRL